MNLATAEMFHAEIARLQAEIDRLRLTDAEREVIQWAANAMRPECRATLRGLLERCSQFAKRESDRPQPIATPSPLSTPAEGSVPTERT